jgi:hypothetical protein
MNLKNYAKASLRELKRNFTFYHNINCPPRWVRKAHEKDLNKLGHRPYNFTKRYIGKNNIYKVEYGMGGQGEAPLKGWLVKKRIK